MVSTAIERGFNYPDILARNNISPDMLLHNYAEVLQALPEAWRMACHAFNTANGIAADAADSYLVEIGRQLFLNSHSSLTKCNGMKTKPAAMWVFDVLAGDIRIVRTGKGKDAVCEIKGAALSAALLIGQPSRTNNNYQPLLGAIFYPDEKELWFNDLKGSLNLERNCLACDPPQIVAPHSRNTASLNVVILKEELQDSQNAAALRFFCEALAAKQGLELALSEAGSVAGVVRELLNGRVDLFVSTTPSIKYGKIAMAVPLLHSQGAWLLNASGLPVQTYFDASGVFRDGLVCSTTLSPAEVFEAGLPRLGGL